MDGDLARAVTKYLFDGAQGTPNLFVVMTFCPPELLEMGDAEKEEWLEEQSSKSKHFEELYKLVGRNQSQFVFVDNLRNMEMVYKNLQEKVLGIQVPLKWKKGSLWAKLRDQIAKEKELLKAKEELRKAQQEKAANDAQKVEELEKEKETSAQKIEQLEKEIKAATEEREKTEQEAAQSVEDEAEKDPENSGSNCFGGMCQVLVKGKGEIYMQELECGDS